MMEITNLIRHVKMKTNPDQIMVTRWQPFTGTWMSSLFPTKGCKDQRAFCMWGVSHLFNMRLGVGEKVRKGESMSRKFNISVAHTHKSKLTCLIIVDVFPLLCLLSPVITNRWGTWDVSWSLPSSRAVSCVAPCHPAPTNLPLSKSLISLHIADIWWPLLCEVVLYHTVPQDSLLSSLTRRIMLLGNDAFESRDNASNGENTFLLDLL